MSINSINTCFVSFFKFSISLILKPWSYSKAPSHHSACVSLLETVYMPRDACQERSNSQYILTFKRKNLLTTTQREEASEKDNGLSSVTQAVPIVGLSHQAAREIRHDNSDRIATRLGVSLYLLVTSLFQFLGETFLLSRAGRRTCLTALFCGICPLHDNG